MFHRSKGKGGGIILLVKKYISKSIHVLKCVYDTAIWVKIDKGLVLCPSDIFMCCLYIPHENNTYYNLYDKNIFEELEYDIRTYSDLGSISLIGDWKCRVGTQFDYIENDCISNQLYETLRDMFNYDSDSYFTVRLSEDTHVNDFGRRMIEMCKSFGLRICNGRKPGDPHGRLTFLQSPGK